MVIFFGMWMKIKSEWIECKPTIETKKENWISNCDGKLGVIWFNFQIRWIMVTACLSAYEYIQLVCWILFDWLHTSTNFKECIVWYRTIT